MATVIIAHTATILAATGVAQSSSLTATVNVTGAFELQVPIRCQFSNVSADPVISVYRLMDNGTNFDTDGVTSFSIARRASATGQKSIALTTGMYAIQMLNSGPNSASFSILTQLAVTAIS